MLRKASIFILILMVNASLMAQCSMCKATVQSNLDNGGSGGSGINAGILYMLALVYVVIMSGLYFFFRRQIHEKARKLKAKFFPHKA